MTRTAEQILKSLVSDIEAMQCGRGDHFGPFNHCDGSDDGVIIEWPNLEITFQEAKTFLNTPKPAG